jgi:hypothetical protein
VHISALSNPAARATPEVHANIRAFHPQKNEQQPSSSDLAKSNNVKVE